VLESADLGSVQQLVMQATPYCNLACDYCYLPDRSDRSRMDIKIIRRTAEILAESSLLSDRIDVRWHAGEPLSVNTDFYEEAATVLREVLGKSTAIGHSVQTNGVLLTDSWMALFKRWDFRVGVSIDGPALIHDAHRKTRKGNGTLAAVERRLGLFGEHGLDFDVISVITPVTLDHKAEYLDYMAALAPRSLGINIEESEGSHQSAAVADVSFVDRFRDFADRLLAWSLATGIPVRELQAVNHFLRSGSAAVRNTQNSPGAILTVTADGTMSTFSPELAGQSHPLLRSAAIGNVFDPDIRAKIAACGTGGIAESIREGVDKCRSECPYFIFCGGGAPVNKFYENGTFASTETVQCRTTIMAFVEAYLESVESRDTSRLRELGELLGTVRSRLGDQAPETVRVAHSYLRELDRQLAAGNLLDMGILEQRAG
jgi:uncharacterized protein